MKRIIYAAMLLAMATGCEKNNDPAAPIAPTDRMISLNPTITKIEKGPQLNGDGSGSFNEGDTFTLYACDEANESSSTDYTIGSTELYWRDLSFAKEGGSVNFAACYPPQVLNGDSFDFTVDQNPESDLLIATTTKAEVGQEQPVALNFRHAMHRLAVKFTSKDPTVEPEAIKTRCTAYTSCKVNLPTGTLTRGDTKNTFVKEGSEVTFLVLPQSTQDVTIEVQIGDNSNRWSIAALEPLFDTLEPGKELTIGFTIISGKIIFSGLTVEGWGDQGTIDGEIIN